MSERESKSSNATARPPSSAACSSCRDHANRTVNSDMPITHVHDLARLLQDLATQNFIAASASVVVSSCHDASPTSGAASGRSSFGDGWMMLKAAPCGSFSI